MNPVFEQYGLKDLLPLKLDVPDEGCTRPNASMYCFDAGKLLIYLCVGSFFKSTQLKPALCCRCKQSCLLSRSRWFGVGMNVCLTSLNVNTRFTTSRESVISLLKKIFKDF